MRTTLLSNGMESLKTAFYFPLPRRGSWVVVQRNFFRFSYSLWPSLLLIVLEPMFYLLAFGYGIGSFLSPEKSAEYVQYLGISLLLIAGIQTSFIEASFGVSKRLEAKPSYSLYALAPFNSIQVAIGEVLWATIKGLIATMPIVAYLILSSSMSLLQLGIGIALAAGILMIFSSLGVYFASRALNANVFFYLQSLLILPIILFSGGYFPISILPEYAEYIVMFSPVYHGLEIFRNLLTDHITYRTFLSLFVLFSYVVFFGNFAMRSLEKKIEKMYHH